MGGGGYTIYGWVRGRFLKNPNKKFILNFFVSRDFFFFIEPHKLCVFFFPPFFKNRKYKNFPSNDFFLASATCV
jgi:hypothetical protein